MPTADYYDIAVPVIFAAWLIVLGVYVFHQLRLLVRYYRLRSRSKDGSSGTSD